jgi:hypothetical protein
VWQHKFGGHETRLSNLSGHTVRGCHDAYGLSGITFVKSCLCFCFESGWIDGIQFLCSKNLPSIFPVNMHKQNFIKVTAGENEVKA